MLDSSGRKGGLVQSINKDMLFNQTYWKTSLKVSSSKTW
uniref:Uncharacterized protein n=1 Tax=Anguilla anguilla TaxID=7936 RepID=A0A0E9WDQ5_ANGAN